MVARSVRQVQHFVEVCEVSGRRRAGTEMRAEVVLRMVRERVLGILVEELSGVERFAYCHSIADEMEGNVFGLVER